LRIPVYFARILRTRLLPDSPIRIEDGLRGPVLRFPARARPGDIVCKCCGGPAGYFGKAPSEKNCAMAPAEPFCPPLAYYRCRLCGFLFTPDMDRWTPAEFQKHIYNDEYARFDPDYREERPRRGLSLVERVLQKHYGLRLLDYGGGNGRLVSLLQHAGYHNTHVYDPFEPDYAARPAGPFDVITCFEVLEHVPDPIAVIGDMRRLLTPHGIIVFTTLYLPHDIETQNTGWWYVAPRNGHISLFTASALYNAGRKLGLRLYDIDSSTHILTVKPLFWNRPGLRGLPRPRQFRFPLGSRYIVLSF
jgi:2-polyprenyl-6-hydroxyphenyl methylase/3-demethylubiquinone-9 3-methyltransferase